MFLCGDDAGGEEGGDGADCAKGGVSLVCADAMRSPDPRLAIDCAALRPAHVDLPHVRDASH